MHFSTIATFLTLALSVAAIPQGPEIHQSKNRCDGGHISCCLEHSDIHADGTLSGVLTQGALTPLLGSKEQSCAKWELIENVNLLGFTKKGNKDSGCKGVTACCPEGKGSCHPL